MERYVLKQTVRLGSKKQTTKKQIFIISLGFKVMYHKQKYENL